MDVTNGLRLAKGLLTSPVRKLTWPAKKEVGAPPGTLIYTGPEREEPVRITSMVFDPDSLAEEVVSDFDGGAIPDSDRVAWINVDGLHDVDLVRRIGEAFRLHPLTLEDLVHTGQRPKMEEYDDYLFVVLRMLTLDSEMVTVRSEQVSIVVGEGWVLSFQERPGDVWDPVRERIRAQGARIRTRASDYLAYALVDAVVDHYYHILERITDTIEELELEVLENPSSETMHRIHNLRQEMLVVRRAVWPLRELTNGLIRSESNLIQEGTQIYLRDVYDHTVQVIDTAETLRDVVSGLMDLYMSSVSNRMNEIMKVLTVMASVFIPLTFLAGIYGMNFEVMPELGIAWAYPALLLVMAGLGIGLLVFFKRRGWL